MGTKGIFEKYCIDTSVFLDLWKEDGDLYKGTFPYIWNHIEKLINKGEIIAPVAVYDELREEKEGEFPEWLRDNNDFFIDISPPQLEFVRKVVDDFPQLTEGTKNGADPFLIALAKCSNLTVLTSEKSSPGKKIPKIPDLCRKYGVTCIDLRTFIVEEGIIVDKAEMKK